MTAAEATSAAAVLHLTEQADPGADPLGLWSPAAAPESAVTYGMAAKTLGTVWRVRLPDDAGAANALLDRAEVSLARSWSALAAVEGRARAFVAAHSTTSFADHPGPTGRRRPELDLDRLLAEPLAAQAGAGGLSYGRRSGLWEQVRAQADAFLVHFDLAIGSHGQIETEQAGRVVARTALGWRGGARTAWQVGLDTDRAVLHQRAVTLVFESRMALLQTLATALQAAVLMAVLFTSGGALLAFPAALRFAAQILAEGRSEAASSTTGP